MIEHPQRRRLNDELHARPALPVRAGSALVHYALTDLVEPERAIARLCREYSAPLPQPDARQVVIEHADGWIVWEQHTEFVSLTISVQDTLPFKPVETLLPLGWLEDLSGQFLVALRLGVVAGSGDDLLTPAVDFHPDCGGSLVSGGYAAVWSDFRLAPGGHVRILIHDFGLTPQRLGRLARRLVELETYRTMALLSLPVAQQASASLARLEAGLVAIGEDLRQPTDGADDRALLDRLTQLAAEQGHLTVATDFRFAAAQAYAALVDKRIGELREERIEGLQRLGGFLDRRFSPAMRTVAATQQRRDRLALRIASATDLLRTRVGVAQEEQNRALLTSMERRAALQLHLQETVEGLSVAAISYYIIGLWKYMIEAGKTFGLPMPSAIANGLAIPIVLGAVWVGFRRLRRRTRDKK